MADHHEPESTQPTHFRWTVFVIACGTSWLLYLHRYVFGLIKPVLVEEWKLGKDELGILDSVFSLTYTGFQIPLGIAVNALGVHVMLTAMLVIWSVGLGLHAWAPSKTMLYTARATLGLGQSAVFAAQSQITRSWFPSSVRTTVQGWLGVFFGRFGGLSANLLVGSVLLGFLGLPWRVVVYGLAVVGIGHAFLFAALYRNSPRDHPRVDSAEADLIEAGDRYSTTATSQRRLTVRELLGRIRPRALGNLLMLNLQTVLSTMADNIFSAWIPLFLWEEHGLRFKEMGFYASLPLLGGAVGGAFGGWLNDRLIRLTDSRRWSRTAVGTAGKVIAGGLLLVSLIWFDSPRTFCVLLLFVKFFSDWSLVTTWGCVTDIGGRASATVFAINNSIAGLGAIVGPILYGWVAEHAGWTPVFLTGAATYLVCGLTWLAINCDLPVLQETEASSQA